MTPPEDAACIEDGCTLDPVTTRPIAQVWLTEHGVITDGCEWVCSIHAGGGSAT